MQPNELNNQSKRKLNPAIISLIIIVVLAAGVGTIYLIPHDETDQTTTAVQTSNASDQTSRSTGTSETAASSASSTSSYTDGTYSATGEYSTPGGTESVSVTATLSGGKIASVKTTGSASGGNSAQYQEAFLSAYESQVVGKSIDEVSLSRVAGSSLTSSGFNAALEEIKKDAVS